MLVSAVYWVVGMKVWNQKLGELSPFSLLSFCCCFGVCGTQQIKARVIVLYLLAGSTGNIHFIVPPITAANLVYAAVRDTQGPLACNLRCFFGYFFLLVFENG